MSDNARLGGTKQFYVSLSCWRILKDAFYQRLAVMILHTLNVNRIIGVLLISMGLCINQRKA